MKNVVIHWRKEVGLERRPYRNNALAELMCREIVQYAGDRYENFVPKGDLPG